MSDLIRGNQLLRSGQLEEAIAAYEKAIACNPHFHWSYCKLGEAFEQWKDWKKAINAYRKAMELNSNSVWSRYKLGAILVENGKIDEGIYNFKKILKYNSNNYRFYQKLGEALFQKGELEEAIANYRKAVEIEPNLTIPDELLEFKFASQNRINFSSMKRERTPCKLRRFVPTHQLHENDIISDITAIILNRFSRFGNNIIQLSQAYHLAKKIGIPKIYLPDFWFIEEGESRTISGIQICKAKQPDFSSEKIALEGQFYFCNSLVPLYKELPNCYEIIPELRSIFNLKYSVDSLNEEDLVIHIRSGDIFQKEKPHGLYGQPPLSFYKKIVELKKWHSISVVFENKFNPVIEPLVQLCKQYSSNVWEISNDLKSDVEYLLRAQTLVASTGTFIPAIAAISKNLKIVYEFDGSFYKSGSSQKISCIFDLRGNSGIICKRIIDQKGSYKSEVLNGNWKNTKSQRELMLDYPTSFLAWDSEFCIN